jgi:hypothetical protein
MTGGFFAILDDIAALLDDNRPGHPPKFLQNSKNASPGKGLA